MSFESGGRADKLGNRYEQLWVIFQLLRIINQEIKSITYEPIGKEGVDLIVCDNDDTLDYQQCNASNGSKDKWVFSDLSKYSFWERAEKYIVEKQGKVSLVSPIPFIASHDISRRARNFAENPANFVNSQVKGNKKQFSYIKAFVERESWLI